MSEKTGNEIPGEVEAEAKAQGWKPEEDWKGDKTKWMPADQYLEVGEKVHKTKIDRLERQNQELKDSVAFLMQGQKKIEQQSYQKALDDIAKRQRKATEAGDVDDFDAAEEEKKRIYKDAQASAQASEQQQPYIDHDFESWKEDNSWFQEDPDMTAYAIGISDQIQRETGYSGRKLYDAVTSRVRKTFSQKFVNQRREAPTAVESGSGASGGGKSKKFEDLPADAKKAYEKFARQIPGFSKEEYLKNYSW